MNKIKSNYYEQIKKLSDQRNTVAHRAIGVLSAITQVYKGNDSVNIPKATVDTMGNLVKEYDLLSEQMRHTDLLIDLVDQKMDEA
tara:strand:- start:170 stop:424 length:255 start_codon:yes stop_codon:yes gene_type:complete